MAFNLHLLRIFAAVAESGSFSQAAKRLYISQPAISKGVQELERQLDISLFDRSARNVALTDAGQVLFQYAQNIFANERAAEAALAQIHDLSAGHLAIGASSTIGIYLLPPLLGEFHRRYPNVKLFLDIGNTEQIAGRLHTTPLDTAFVEGPWSAPEMDILPWRPDLLVVIATPDHALAGRQAITIDEAQRWPFVLREEGSGTRVVLETALRELGISLDVAMELGSTEAVKQAVSAGLGLAVVSVATIAKELALGSLVVVDIPALTLPRTLTRLRVRGRPPSRALQAFLSLVAESA